MLIVISACGGMSRDDYISELTRDGELTDEVAECVYREIAGDESVLDDIEENGADGVSDESTDVLAVALAKCLIELPEDQGGAAETGDTEDTEPDTGVEDG